MTRAALLAGAAGACAVLGGWEALVALERAKVAAAVARVLAPLRARGRRVASRPSPSAGALRSLPPGRCSPAGGSCSGRSAACCSPRPDRPRCSAPPAPAAAATCAELARGAPLAARALSDALAGGHAIRGAIGQAARGLPALRGTELRATAARLELGEATEIALERLRRRAVSPAWDTIVAAILLTREAGGDLARLLRGCAQSLEDATRLEAEARSATAQARFTGLLVMALPAGAAGLAELASPGYIASLARAPLTAWLVGCAVLCQLVAFAAIHRLARVAR